MPREVDHKLEGIIQHLGFQLRRGWACLDISEEIFAAYQAGRIETADIFFLNVYFSCLDTVFLMLARTLDMKSGISVHYLLNMAKDHPTVFPHAAKDTILTTVTHHKEQLKQSISLWKKIREQRNRIIAHLDRSAVSNPDKLVTHSPMNSREAEELYRELCDIVDTYSRYWYGARLDIEEDIRNSRVATGSVIDQIQDELSTDDHRGDIWRWIRDGLLQSRNA